MIDNKLTDNEIIKALEDKFQRVEYPWVDSSWCDVEISLLKNAIDLINRQQAENEWLKELCESIQEDKSFLGKEITKYHKELLKSKVFKFVRNPNRIYNIMDFQDGEILVFYDYPENPSALSKGYLLFKGKDDIRLLHISEVKELSYAEIKAEAIKEFAKRLKDDMVPNIDDSYIESFVEEYIDNLVKEMVGEE